MRRDCHVRRVCGLTPERVPVSLIHHPVLNSLGFECRIVSCSCLEHLDYSLDFSACILSLNVIFATA